VDGSGRYWHLHSMIGFWTFAFTVVFALSGAYSVFPRDVSGIRGSARPGSPTRTRRACSDQVIYWLAYLHFGRINGIGIPCSGPGLCDQATKAAWAFLRTRTRGDVRHRRESCGGTASCVRGRALNRRPSLMPSSRQPSRSDRTGASRRAIDVMAVRETWACRRDGFV
jgi:hypothetical protein